MRINYCRVYNENNFLVNGILAAFGFRGVASTNIN